MPAEHATPIPERPGAFLITDAAQLGPALGDIRKLLGLTRRELVRRIVAATGRTETSVNAQLVGWDSGKFSPNPASLPPALKALGLRLAVVFDQPEGDTNDPR
ncbi:hypothetical protein ACQPZJ_01640 [Actinoplanes sp. CA-054009]